MDDSFKKTGFVKTCKQYSGGQMIGKTECFDDNDRFNRTCWARYAARKSNKMMRGALSPGENNYQWEFIKTHCEVRINRSHPLECALHILSPVDGMLVTAFTHH